MWGAPATFQRGRLSQRNRFCQQGCDPVTAPQRQWHYGFSRNIVGIAAIQPAAFKLKPTETKGEITVQYCQCRQSAWAVWLLPRL